MCMRCFRTRLSEVYWKATVLSHLVAETETRSYFLPVIGVIYYLIVPAEIRINSKTISFPTAQYTSHT